MPETALPPSTPAEDPAGSPPPTDGDLRVDRSTRLATWAFGAYVAAGLPLLVLVIGKFWWFFRDDWFFITDRDLSVQSLFEDHNGHWSTSPILVFRALFAVFGLHSYAPYKAAVVVAHLVVVVSVRAIMRRYHVGPWLATVLAGSLVLFGSGREDILWAFQIGFTGSVALCLLQWALADRENQLDRIDRLDVAGAACALVAVTASSPPVPILAGLAITLLVRRGWKATVVHIGPAATAYLVWSLVVQPERSSPFGPPPFGALVDWVQDGVISTFDDLTGHRWISVILGVTVAVGTALAILRPPTSAATTTTTDLGSSGRLGRAVAIVRRRLHGSIGPIAMFGSTVAFILLAAQRAWIFGPTAASASRYIYAYAALTLPIIALSIQASAERWRPAGPLLVVLVLAGVPTNIERFRDPIFGPDHHAHQRDLLMNVVRSPAVVHAPDDLRPDPDPYNSPGLTVGFFRDAQAAGKLPDISGPIPTAIAAELIVRLGLRQEAGSWLAEACERTEIDRFRPDQGTRFTFDAPMQVTVNGHQGMQFPTHLRPDYGSVVTVVAPDLDLSLAAAGGGPATICVVP